MKNLEQKYQKLTDIEHCLKRPGRYIGSVKPREALAWLYDESKTEMIQEEITWNPGFIKLFDEIISNSVDFSKTPEGKHLNQIRVEIDKESGEISVHDNGGIPVQIHTEYKEYIPTMIFGYLRSGSNFDDDEDSDGTGQNGEGSSLVNIFSTKFTVETCDGKNKFKQTWTNNMRSKTKPTTGESSSKAFTKITFLPDYEQLETTLDEGNYKKLVKRVCDVAGCNPKLRVYLNGTQIKIGNFKDYIGMYTSDFEFDDNGDWQVGVAKSDDGFQHISFVNTTETLQGGNHVHYVWHQIATKLREYIKKRHKIDVRQSEIQSHMKIFINARIINPRYDSQTKENLITEVKDFKTSWKVDDKFISRIIKSEIIQKVLDWAAAREKAAEMAKLRSMNKDTDKANPKRIIKLQDANLAGKQPDKCILFLVEGDCMEENTLVHILDENGFSDKPLNRVNVGDMVLTHENRYRPILHISFLVKETITIKFGKETIRVSPNHRILAYDPDTREFDWVEAKDLTVKHKLIKNTLHGTIHAPVTETKVGEELTFISYDTGGIEDSMIQATNDTKICVFNDETLCYESIEAQKIEEHHSLIFRLRP